MSVATPGPIPSTQHHRQPVFDSVAPGSPQSVHPPISTTSAWSLPIWDPIMIQAPMHPALSRRPDKSDKLEVCREFLRGICNRTEEECKFAHPPGDVVVDPIDGMITVCMDFIKSRCSRDCCKFFHPPAHLQARVKANQLGSPLSSPYMNPLTGMLFQDPSQSPLMFPMYPPHLGMSGTPNSPFVPMFFFPPSLVPESDYPQPVKSPKSENQMLPVCRDFLSGRCERQSCRYIHLLDKNVEVMDGKVTVCRDASKGRCLRTNCKYYHVPQ